MEAGAAIALIDVREHGEYNSAHIPGASLLPRRLLEFEMEPLVPFKGVRVIVCDDDGRRAALAANTLERMGYGHVSVLGGGTNRWVSQGFPTEWGMNVPSKEFGEKLEVVHHIPGMDAQELHDRVERGDKLVILDTRTPEEYQRACIPGGRSVPGAELALRIPDITKDLDPDTTIVHQLRRAHPQYRGNPLAPAHGGPQHIRPEERHIRLDPGRAGAGVRGRPAGADPTFRRRPRRLRGLRGPSG